MAWVQIASISQTVSGQTTVYTLYEKDAVNVTATTLNVVETSAPKRRAGVSNGDILEPHLPTSIELRVRDKDRFLLNRFLEKGEADFRLDITKGTLYNRLNVLLGSERPEIGIDDPVITLTAFDGVTRLQFVDFDVEALETTFPNGATPVEMFQNILDELGHELDVYAYFGWQHTGYDLSRAPAHAIRHKIKDLLEKDTTRTKYDVLIRLLQFFQAQLMQESGAWRIMERHFRGGPMNYAKAAYGGAVTSFDSAKAIWELDEAAAATRVDSYGTNNLSDVNSVAQGAGPGNAAQFTAANSEYFSVADSADFNIGSSDFWWQAWIYVDSTGVLRTIASKFQDGNNYYRLTWTAADRLKFLAVVGGTTKVDVESNGSKLAATWYHVLVVVDRDSTSNTKIYINGVNDTSGTPTVSTDSIDNTGAFRVGQRNSTDFWNGRMQHLAFGKRTIEAAEVTWLYNSGAGRRFNTFGTPGDGGRLHVGLVAYYVLGEASGTRNDAWGSNHLTDNATVTAAQGRVECGKSAVFASASSERLTISSNSNLQFNARDWSIGMWVSTTTLSGNHSIAAKATTGAAGIEVLIRQAAANLEVFVADGTTSTTITTNSVFAATNTWYFIIVRFKNSNNEITVYVNNVLVKTQTVAHEIQAASNSFNFGGRSDAAQFWDGSISLGFKIDRVISALELSRLWNNGQGLTAEEIILILGEDRQVAISDAAIVKGAIDPSLQPIPSVTSRYLFGGTPLQNGRFEEWEDGNTKPVGWSKQASGTPALHEVNGKRGVQLNASADAVYQRCTEGLNASERIRFVIDIIDIDYDAAFISGSITAEIGQIILTNTQDGQDRYLQNDRTWTTTATALTRSIQAGEIVAPIILETSLPVAGTLSLHTRFSPNPNASGADEFDAWTYGEFSYERLSIGEPLENIEYKVEGSVSTSIEPIEEEFAIGDYTAFNPGQGVIAYLDKATGLWKKTVDWDQYTASDQSIHQIRPARRLKQQGVRLKGLDFTVAPDTDIAIGDTIIYEDTDYIPLYEEEDFWTRTKRFIAYELRSDARNAERIYNPRQAPTARPSPKFNLEFELRNDEKYDVYLLAQPDLNTGAIQWEYEVNGAIVNSGVSEVTSLDLLKILVNSGNPLEIGTVSPEFRAWGWSSYSGGAGQGLRSLRVWEQTDLFSIFPDASFRLEFRPAKALATTSDPFPDEIDIWLHFEPNVFCGAIKWSFWIGRGGTWSVIDSTTDQVINTAWTSADFSGDIDYKAEFAQDGKIRSLNLSAYTSGGLDPAERVKVDDILSVRAVAWQTYNAGIAAGNSQIIGRCLDDTRIMKPVAHGIGRDGYSDLRAGPVLEYGLMAATMKSGVGVSRGVWAFDPFSTAADNGEDILKPDALGGSDPGRWIRVKEPGPVPAERYGVVAGTVSLANFQTFIDNVSSRGGNEIILDYGTYNVNPTGSSSDSDPVRYGVILKSKVTIRGRGKGTIIQHNGVLAAGNPTYAFSVNPGSGGTSSVSGNTTDVGLCDMTIRGKVDVANYKFNEHTHLLNINACSRGVFDRLFLEAWQGDAIYLGSSNIAATERHNEDIWITRVVFNGLATQKTSNGTTGTTQNNRCAIGVIDCTNLVVWGCEVQDCSSANMPGAIDIEPDDNDFYRIRNIIIANSRFYDIGGNVGVVALVLRQRDSVTTRPSKITFRDLHIEEGDASAFLAKYQTDGVDALIDRSIKPLGFVAENIYAKNCNRPFILTGIPGGTVTKSTFETCTNGALVGYTDFDHETNRDIKITKNEFYKCGEDGNVLVAYAMDGLDIIENTFIDAGKSGTPGVAISLRQAKSKQFATGYNIYGNEYVKTDWMDSNPFQIVSGFMYRPSTFNRGLEKYVGFSSHPVNTLESKIELSNHRIRIRGAESYGTFTADAGTDRLTFSGWTPVDGSPIIISNVGGALPAATPSLSLGGLYYCRDISGSTAKIASTLGGAAIDITGAGTGTHLFRTQTKYTSLGALDTEGHILITEGQMALLSGDAITLDLPLSSVFDIRDKDNTATRFVRIHKDGLTAGRGGTSNNDANIIADAGNGGGAPSFQAHRNAVIESIFGTAGATNDFLTGAIAGDTVIYALQKLLFGINGAKTVTIDADELNLETGVVLKAAGTQVVSTRRTGWSAWTGTASRLSYGSHLSQTISNPPTQTQVQNIDNSLVSVTQAMKALLDDLIAHGLIGA